MEVCLECNEQFTNKLKLSAHIKFFHKISIKQYRIKHLIGVCKNCGILLWSATTATNLCKLCFVSTGESKKTWQRKEYREKVIKAISKPRVESFKKEQSDRIKEWYKNNPQQKEIRSIKMKETWERGALGTKKSSIIRSKGELDLFQELENICLNISKECIKTKNRNYFPDILFKNEGIIIEYYGSYWHANPERFKAKEIVHHNTTAEEIWEQDSNRISGLEEEGYQVIIIWDCDYKQNKEDILNNLNNLLNWDSCSF